MAANSVPTRQIYREHLRPSWWAWLGITAVSLLTLGFLCSAAVQAAPPSVLGTFCTGPIFLLPLLLLVRQDRPAGRIYPLAVAAFAIGLTGLIAAILFALLPTEGISSGVGLFTAITVPFSLILLIPLFFYLRQTVQELRAALHQNRVLRTAELIAKKGLLTFSELGQQLGVSPTIVDNLVDEVREQQLLPVTMYVPFQRVYENQHLGQQQLVVIDLVEQRGQLFLDDLAVEMATPPPLLIEWIYQLVHHNRFVGFINWETAVIYASSAAKLRENSRCPNCNGQLALDGERVRCPYCSSEILLGSAA